MIFATSAKRYSSKANTLKAVLYFSVSVDVALTSNLWTELHNGAKGAVVDFVYTDSERPRNDGVPEALV